MHYIERWIMSSDERVMISGRFDLEKRIEPVSKSGKITLAGQSELEIVS